MKKASLYLVMACIFLVFTTAGALAAPGDFTLLHEFAGGVDDGGRPYSQSLVEDGGTLYGMTYQGGDSNMGTVFSLPAGGGPITLLHEFAGGADDGAWPRGSLVLSGGALYGMTSSGGDSNRGTVFSIPAGGGPITLLHEFAGGVDDGQNPFGSLILSGGTLYGMTYLGGDSDLGTVFSLPAGGGPITLLHEFAGGVDDGRYPFSHLVLSGGTLYGMTRYGGDSNAGTVFSLPAGGGPITLLHEFAGGADDGGTPFGSLVLSGGTLYGMTYQGGDSDLGTVFSLPAGGGPITLLHEFAGDADDGRYPYGHLVLSGGTFYGMTLFGGDSNLGVIFSIPAGGGPITLLREFAGGVDDGQFPYFGGPVISGNFLYGQTYQGGDSNMGMVFKYELASSVPPSPTGTPDWTTETSNTTDQLNGVWTTTGPEAFACGNGGRIQHYDGAAWAQMTSNTTDDLNAAWGSSNTDVFAVGVGGRIQHYDGTWSQMTSNTTDNLNGVHGTSGTDVFAVGAGGRIQHYDGAWSQMTSNTGADLNAVYAAAADDVFAVGAGGVIMHYNGTAWSAMASYTTNTLNAVWGTSGTNVYAVGDGGAIGHYNGTAWTKQASGITPAAFSGVYSAFDRVFAVGELGWIVQFDGASWAAMVSGTAKQLSGVCGGQYMYPGFFTVFAVGADGTIRSYNLIDPSCFIRTLLR